MYGKENKNKFSVVINSEFHVNMPHNFQAVHNEITLRVQWNCIFSKQSVLNVLNLRIWKTFTRAVSPTLATSYFHYYEMPRSFSFPKRALNLYLPQWWHWEMPTMMINTKETTFNTKETSWVLKTLKRE